VPITVFIEAAAGARVACQRPVVDHVRSEGEGAGGVSGGNRAGVCLEIAIVEAFEDACVHFGQRPWVRRLYARVIVRARIAVGASTIARFGAAPITAFFV
jgi:hypothetical protein